MRLRFISRLFIAFLPSRVKIVILNALGNNVHHTAKIGLSVLDIDKIVMEPHTYIGHGNIFKNVPILEMKSGSRINRWNKFTSNRMNHSRLLMGERSSISLNHYFDVCNLIEVGSDTIIAGRNSVFFTHSKGIDIIDYSKPIVIGSWCYLGSGLNVCPGSKIGHNCFVGMGSVLSGDKSEESYTLWIGNPAEKKKKIDKNCSYFKDQPKIRHMHIDY